LLQRHLKGFGTDSLELLKIQCPKPGNHQNGEKIRKRLEAHSRRIQKELPIFRNQQITF
jgi:hypothetical protein